MLDESGSAEEAAPWCKAVALALLDIAMRDHRRFAMIHFSGKGHFKTDLFIPQQYDREDVLRAAELFFERRYGLHNSAPGGPALDGGRWI